MSWWSKWHWFNLVRLLNQEHREGIFSLASIKSKVCTYLQAGHSIIYSFNVHHPKTSKRLIFLKRSISGGAGVHCTPVLWERPLLTPKFSAFYRQYTPRSPNYPYIWISNKDMHPPCFQIPMHPLYLLELYLATFFLCRKYTVKESVHQKNISDCPVCIWFWPNLI